MQAIKRRKNATTIRELLKSSIAPLALLFFHHIGGSGREVERSTKIYCIKLDIKIIMKYNNKNDSNNNKEKQQNKIK